MVGNDVQTYKAASNRHGGLGVAFPRVLEVGHDHQGLLNLNDGTAKDFRDAALEVIGVGQAEQHGAQLLQVDVAEVLVAETLNREPARSRQPGG